MKTKQSLPRDLRHFGTVAFPVPVAPDMTEFIAANVTWVTLRLSTWRSGGCPISSFTVLYKRQSSVEDWTPAATRHASEQGLAHHTHVTVEDLAPATWYQLLVTAENEAGSTEAEYVFATLTLAGGMPASFFRRVNHTDALGFLLSQNMHM
ncbi:hypothetical protein HPB50_002496 [Hyalomma asiaticum]|uniref:Uncharacterized protein n=1 Tax=Hyalomma asiaticum TaxID=266040 RepID=A0ACB7SJC0_HYAAI|nr:hypothetical protein HPB50_002496 [Hyalomma asiaticum]